MSHGKISAFRPTLRGRVVAPSVHTCARAVRLRTWVHKREPSLGAIRVPYSETGLGQKGQESTGGESVVSWDRKWGPPRLGSKQPTKIIHDPPLSVHGVELSRPDLRTLDVSFVGPTSVPTPRQQSAVRPSCRWFPRPNSTRRVHCSSEVSPVCRLVTSVSCPVTLRPLKVEPRDLPRGSFILNGRKLPKERTEAYRTSDLKTPGTKRVSFNEGL